MRELEQRLAEQHMQLQKHGSVERHERSRRKSHDPGEFEQVEGRREEDADSSGTSAVTGDGTTRTQGGAGVADPMDEGMISNIQGSSSASIDTRTDSVGAQRGSTREGGDEVMSDVSGMARFVCGFWAACCTVEDIVWPD